MQKPGKLRVERVWALNRIEFPFQWKVPFRAIWSKKRRKQRKQKWPFWGDFWPFLKKFFSPELWSVIGWLYYRLCWDWATFPLLIDLISHSCPMCPMPNYLPKLDFHVDVDIDVGHHVHLHVGHRVGYCIGHHNVVSTICEGSETLTCSKSKVGS